jgi:hypothetical protein
LPRERLPELERASRERVENPREGALVGPVVLPRVHPRHVGRFLLGVLRVPLQPRLLVVHLLALLVARAKAVQVALDGFDLGLDQLLEAGCAERNGLVSGLVGRSRFALHLGQRLDARNTFALRRDRCRHEAAFARSGAPHDLAEREIGQGLAGRVACLGCARGC